MFPNLRLLIAAAMASVVVLIFGAGMLASVRVSREPLAHVIPVVVAPLPPLVEGDGARPLAFAPAEPFDRRFHTGEVQPAGDAMTALTQALTRALADRERTEAPLRASATPSRAAKTIETAKPAAATNEVAPAAAASPPVTKAAPEASDDPPLASLPEHQSAATGNAEAAALAPSPATADPAATELAAILAAVEPPTETLKTLSDIATASAAKPHAGADATEKKAEKAAEPKPRHPHAARHRVRPANPDGSFQQSNFGAAPAWQQQPVRTRRANVASRQTKDATLGAGGPFVSAPAR
jgi:hypothetical protein